jgi:hypothetical protein
VNGDLGRDDPTVSELLARAREIWAGQPLMTLPEVAVAACVVAGDLARAARAPLSPHSWQDAERELGDLVLSAVRWAADMGLDLGDCLAAAEQAQRVYVATLRGEQP